MSDEKTPTTAATLDRSNESEAVAGLDAPKPLQQSVNIVDVGPCRKHIRVIINRPDIDERINEQFKKMMPEVVVPGYRPGKAPRKLIEKRFFREVAEQIKGELLLQSLEQLAEEYKLNPISLPNINPEQIDLPETGPLVYEFEIEVAPEFELLPYKGLKLKRPVKEITEADIDQALKRFLRRLGVTVTKDGPADLDDIIVADVVVTHEGEQLTSMSKVQLRLDPQLAFSDGVAPDFGAKMKGVQAGEERTLEIHLSPALANANLRGKTVQGTFKVSAVQTVKEPELSDAFFAVMGVANLEQLREKIRVSLQRQLEYEQRRSAREQVLAHIGAAATWDLPNDLLHRQAAQALNRQILELRSSGFAEEEIKARINVLRQDIMASTAKALKEHFVLQKIAEVEKIEVTDEDVNFEIENMAEQAGESVRKVRARIERENLMESVMTEILERKALDLVLEHAEYEDVPFQPSGITEGLGAVEAAATGEEPAAPLPAEPAAS